MTHDQAQKILDRVREGEAYPRSIVDRALCLTGDIDLHEAMRGAGMVEAVQGQGAGKWSLGRNELVAQDGSRH